jgi:FkbM family methyltransferase
VARHLGQARRRCLGSASVCDVSFKEEVSRRLTKAPALRRIAATAFHPSHRGRRTAAIGHALGYELWTNILGHPSRIPIGERSHIIAYKGETNPPHAVMHNPPNWPEMLVWKRYLRPGDLFIDIGANIGSYSVYAAECGAEVISVEPVPHNAKRVRENLNLNGYAGQVVQKALSDHPGSVRITADKDSLNHLVDEGGIEVTATTLDDLLGNRSAVAKIDVEGAEELVLAGARKALSEHRIRLLQLEWAVSERLGISDRVNAQTILDEAGYELFLCDRFGVLSPLGCRPFTSLNVFAMPVTR